MSKKVCTAGVQGSYSYIVVDSGSEVVAEIHDDESQIASTTFPEMEIAEKWTDKYLTQLVRINDEID